MAGDSATSTPSAAARDAARQAEQLQSTLGHLQNAVTKAKTYLEDPNAVSEVLSIHITFVSQRISGVEKVVNSINRRNRNDDLILPDEAEHASDLLRDLQIRRAELIREEKEREKLEAAANAAATRGAASAAATMTATPVIVVKKPPLPPLPIPRFAGNVMEYNNFITVFDETVHKNETLASSQKLVYLQSYMEGEAKKLIANILVSDANYEVARGILQSNYGQSTQTISLLYDRLHAVQRCRNDPFSIRDTYNEIEAIFQMLEHAGVDINSDQYLFNEMVKKWPWALVRQLVRTPDMGMKQFREELAKEIQLQLQLTQMAGYTPIASRPKPYGNGKNFKNRYGNAATASGSTYSTPAVSATTGASSGAGWTKAPAQNGVAAMGQAGRRGESAAVTNEVPMPATPSAHCPFCKERHHAENCDQYKTARQRTDRILGKKCQKCFRDLHEGIPCINNFKCRYCPSYEHNRALCPVKYGDQNSQTLFTEQKEKSGAAGLFMTLLVQVYNPDTEDVATLRMLIDPACNRTALTEDAARKIKITPRNMKKRPVKGMGDRLVEAVTEETIKIRLQTNQEQPAVLNVKLTAKIADDVPVYDTQLFRHKYPEFDKFVIPPTGAGSPIDLIVGTDYLVRLLTLESCVKVDEKCQLLATQFGWIIFAENPEPTEVNEHNLFTYFTRSEDLIQTMWDLDVVGMKSLSQADADYEERALSIFYHTIKFVDGRYEVHWPWRSYPPNLNENYGLAMGRLRALLRRLSEQPELLAAYNAIILEQIEEGVLEEVPREQIRTTNVVHYIPHHAVVALEKSTPVRVVTDAAATVGKAKSLNDNILKGNKWLGSTVGSLIRFRRYENAVTADIRHAFHQISIAPKDRDAVRFIWVYDCTKPPAGENIRILRFKRVAFGIVASPFLLYATIQYHLRNNKTRYTEILCREMYADNLLVSLPHSTDMVDFYVTTKQLFSAMSMDMTKWKSNAKRLSEFIPVADQIAEKETSVLGMVWNAQHDTFGLKRPRIAHLQGVEPTKRLVLKTMAAIFDPLGWISPFVLRIRIFLRTLWLKKKSWDSQLEHSDVEIWNEIKEEIQSIETITTKRRYFATEIDDQTKHYELHTFVDASADAIGSVTYLREIGDVVDVEIVMAKSRLSPAVKTSIPRLEFYALLMGVRLQSYLAEHLELKAEIKKFIWSDSKCALAWVSTNKLLPVAIEKHLAEIHAAKVNNFNYVPSALNPADIASRGMRLTELKQTSWFRGPEWLRQDEKCWPQQEPITYEEKEELVEKTLFIQGQFVREIAPPFFLNMQMFSEWKALLRRTAYCIYSLNRCLKKDVISVRAPVDYDAARTLWIRWDQRRNGADEDSILQKIKHFKKVELFRDGRNLLRCRSRITQSELPWQTTEPIILVKGSYITELIVMDIHRRNLHAGTAHTLATLRKNYWLVHGRREIYRIIHAKCLNCKFYDAQPFPPPKEAVLPKFRVTQSRPFENTGIDTLGPFYVFSTESQNKTEIKRWVLLITCLVVRAVHLEVLAGLDTQDILCAIKRFVARRGTPAMILCDNSKQFHLISGCMRELWHHFSEEESSTRYFAEQSIVWKFIPDYSPWMGGAYERLVQNTKQAFKRTYGEQTISQREFDTTIVEIESIINNRPITYVDRNLETPLLTPNHFLRAAYPAIPIQPETIEAPKLTTRTILLQYWKDSEQHMNYFWQIWSQHYLLALREIRGKTAKTEIKPRVGEIVLMVHPTLKRGFWKKGIIERLIHSHDEKVRAVQVRLPSGVRVIRPLQKVVSLELLDRLPENEAPASSTGISSSAPTSEDVIEELTEEDEESRNTAAVVELVSGFGSLQK